ncbi:MAG: hypothetical protein ACREJB_16745 [Planctomycetaceae bacterium]
MRLSRAALIRGASPLATLLLYGVSLSLPAIAVNGRSGAAPVPGYEAVIAGVFALVMLFQPAVLANPAIWTGLVLLACGRWRSAAVAGALAVVLTLSALLIYDPAAPPQGGGADSPSTHPPRIIQLLPGYYCWVASAAILTAAGVLGMRGRYTAIQENE